MVGSIALVQTGRPGLLGSTKPAKCGASFDLAAPTEHSATAGSSLAIGNEEIRVTQTFVLEPLARLTTASAYEVFERHAKHGGR